MMVCGMGEEWRNKRVKRWTIVRTTTERMEG
jgi:hypothetical protein